MSDRFLTPRRRFLAGAAAIVVAGAVIGTSAYAQNLTLLNVSYDPTRELYEAYNAAFVTHWQQTTGQTITIQQSHGGSGAQARSVVDGNQADVVTLALEGDINLIAAAGLIDPNWRTLLPNNSAPYTSTIVFVVRAGNPKNIHDWSDLVRDDVDVITPNPKTSGGARWNFLAAWAFAESQSNGDQAAAQEFVRQLYANVSVLDTGARGSTQTFVQRGTGDVLIAWENEAHLTVQEFGAGEYEIVVPSQSILAEPPVAVVTRNAEAHGTTAVATAYLEYLYSPEGQRIAAENYYRPSVRDGIDPALLANFPEIPLTTIEHFGGWAEAQPRFFGDGAVFDQIYVPAP
ncbi:MAG: sulfate ABC transporter substrate-binding protein [Bauldia sp.]